MKKFLALALTLVMTLAMASCSDKDNTTKTETDVTVAAFKGPTGMGMVKMMDDNENNISDGNNYNFEILGSPEEMSTKIIKGEVDIAAVPANLSSSLYNKANGEIEVIAINTLGVIYIVENGDTIQSVDDLKGKTIYASGQNATPEFSLNYILSENGINPENDVDIQYKSEHAECLTALISDENGIAMLPQPFVTIAQTKSENVRIALDMTKEWENIQQASDTSSTMITGVMVAQKDFIENNPDALNAFLDSYKKSVDFVNSDVEAAAKLNGKFEIVTEEVALKAIPYCNITFIEGSDMKTKLSGYLNILFEQSEKSIGGKMPDDNFYYSREEN